MKKIGLFVVLLCLLPAFTGSAATRPLYSVAYSADQQVYLTSFYADKSTQTVEVPFMLWQYSVGLVAPVWSGTTLWGTVLTDFIYEDVGNVGGGFSIAGYDLLADTLTEPIVLVEEPRYEAMRIDGISPDQRYAWVLYTDYFHLPGLLVDLETGEIQETTCANTLVGWLPDAAVARNQGIDECSIEVYPVSLADGTRGAAYPIPADLGFLEPDHSVALQDGRLVFGGTYYGDKDSVMGIVGGAADQFFTADSFPAISADERYLAYLADGELVILDLNTLAEVDRISDVPVLYPFYRPVWTDNTLHFWRVEGSTYTYVTWEDGLANEVEIYNGETPAQAYPNPDNALLVLSFADRTEIHNPLVRWNSGTDFPAETMIDPFTPPTWIGDWVILPGSLAFNASTGEKIEPPLPGATFVSASPDQAWWLYAVIRAEDDGNHDSLLAYHRASGEIVTLLEDVYLEQNNFHFAPYEYYVWSEMWE